MGEDLLDRYLRVPVDPRTAVLDSSQPATGVGQLTGRSTPTCCTWIWWSIRDPSCFMVGTHGSAGSLRGLRVDAARARLRDRSSRAPNRVPAGSGSRIGRRSTGSLAEACARAGRTMAAASPCWAARASSPSGAPELAFSGNVVSCRYAIQGGLLALRAGGSVTLAQRHADDEVELSVIVEEYLPRLAARLGAPGGRERSTPRDRAHCMPPSAAATSSYSPRGQACEGYGLWRDRSRRAAHFSRSSWPTTSSSPSRAPRTQRSKASVGSRATRAPPMTSRERSRAQRSSTTSSTHSAGVTSSGRIE